jgi:hypothetical protein
MCVYGALGSFCLQEWLVHQSVNKKIGYHFLILGEPTLTWKELSVLLLKDYIELDKKLLEKLYFENYRVQKFTSKKLGGSESFLASEMR